MHTLQKMLEKDPADRYQSVHEVLTNLSRLREDSGRVRIVGTGAASPVPVLGLDRLCRRTGNWRWIWRRCVPFGISPDDSPTPTPLLRFSIQLPEGERLFGYSRHAVAVSPDGRWVAYESFKPSDRETLPDRDYAMNLQRLDRNEVRRIPGYNLNPFFSPDSAAVGFRGACRGRKLSIAENRGRRRAHRNSGQFEDGTLWLCLAAG